MGVAETEAERASEKRYWGVGNVRFTAMIPPQEASARRREIEDKLKQVGLGLEKAGRNDRKGPGASLGVTLGKEAGWDGGAR